MYNLLYTSSSTMEANHEVLNEILQTARVNNQKLGITGMLLYSEGSFVQQLEGDEEKVKEKFNKISKDAGITILKSWLKQTLPTAIFPNGRWVLNGSKNPISGKSKITKTLILKIISEDLTLIN